MQAWVRAWLVEDSPLGLTSQPPSGNCLSPSVSLSALTISISSRFRDEFSASSNACCADALCARPGCSTVLPCRATFSFPRTAASLVADACAPHMSFSTCREGMHPWQA